MDGQRIGNYRVVRKVGQGGMGAVYEAVDEQLGRKVALKLLRRELCNDPQIKQRFLNEARAASRVEHPGIVKIYAFGDLPDHSAFIAMEFLRGEALSARLRGMGGRLPLADTIRISRQISAALAATHQLGIVHRDLKPDNVMLVPDTELSSGERVKVLDFGIAKVDMQYGGAGAEEYRTNTGMVLGTATYMAPEQCKGAGNVTGQADVYSLGVVMYRMLTGNLPFRAEGQGEIMAMHIFQTAKPVRELDPNIPEAIDALVQRMMAKDPAERPTMVQVGAELEKLTALPAIAGQPVFVMVSGSGGDQSSSGASLATLSAALGQSGALKAVTTPAGRSRVLLWGGALCLLVLGGLGVRMALGGGPFGFGGPKPAPAGTSQQVHWTLSSNPDGAEVLRKSDGQSLGFTPWNHDEPQGSGPFAVVLRKPGHEDLEIVFERHLSMSRHAKLVAAAAPQVAPTPPGSPTGTEPGATPGGSSTAAPLPPGTTPDGPPGTFRNPGKLPGAPGPGQNPATGSGNRRKTRGDNPGILTDDNVQIIQ